MTGNGKLDYSGLALVAFSLALVITLGKHAFSTRREPSHGW
jgi:hypothetical protein